LKEEKEKIRTENSKDERKGKSDRKQEENKRTRRK
jgi:hypothetical protein